MLFAYPVYQEDIAPLGFDVISLGTEATRSKATGMMTVNDERFHSAVKQAVDVLTYADHRAKIVENNFNLAKQNLSFSRLGDILKNLLKDVLD
jgi:hypothetical protein